MAIWDSFTNQKQWKEYLKHLVITNEKALLKSIVVIYDNQTLEEKEIGTSICENKVGFNRLDAEEMTRLARKIKLGTKLTQNEIAHARIVMPKYWKQLMVISKQKQKDKKEYKEFEEAIAKIQSVVQETQEFSHEIVKSMYRCMNEGISCSYCICDECQNVNNKSDKDDDAEI